jgi:hypothetical protein
MNKIVLKGIDGANPLGFLAALGTVVTVRRVCQRISMGWLTDYGTWRPYLLGFEGTERTLADEIASALSETTAAPFDIDKKLPFSIKSFSRALKEIQMRATPNDRRGADLLGSFGSDACPDKEKENFQDTFFRMVRSGDANGQGLPYYAISIRNLTGVEELRRTLFQIWEYQDKGFSLRWDPLEDQRYALRWRDPSKSKEGTMNGANALALEALSLFPSMPVQTDLATTGFFKSKQKRVYFTWPIWESAIMVDIVRSLLAMQELHEDRPQREELMARGIVEIYRCERIAPNQYYRNFSPAFPT